MAIEYTVTMFKCEYRCGKYSRNRRFIEGHEQYCWRNPDLKTCKTCQYEVYYTDTSGTAHGYTEPEWYYRNCSHPVKDAQDNIQNGLDAVYHKVEQDNKDFPGMYGVHIPPIVNCEYWKQKKANT